MSDVLDFQVDGAPAPPKASRPATVVVPRMVQSEEVDQILPALCKLHKSLHNPRRDKLAKVKGQTPDGKWYDYTYRYSSAAVINDMLREPMGDCDLVPMHRPLYSREEGHQYLTQIYHAPSGQWIGCLWPLGDVGKKPQSFAGACTYAGRYSMNALLHISSGEDDDANQASGRPAEISDRRQRQVDIEEQRDVYLQLLRRARQVRRPLDGQPLLSLWHDEMSRMAPMRDDALVEQQGIFKLLVSEMTKALGIAYGASLAKCWSKIIDARSKLDVEEVQQLFSDTATAAEAKEMKRAHQQAWSMFQEHMRFFSERAIDADSEQDAPENEDRPRIDEAFSKAKATLPQEPELRNDATFLDRMIGTKPPPFRLPADKPDPIMDPEPKPVAPPGFAHHVFDEQGEVATDLITEPLAWVRAYVATWASSDRPVEVDRRNSVGLRAVEGNPEAEKLMERLLENPEDATGAVTPPKPAEAATARRQVVWPRNRSGNLDVAATLRALDAELGALRSLEEWNEWLILNEPTWYVEEFPITARRKIEAAVLRRKGELAGGRAR